MKFKAYQTVQDVINAVCSPSDVEALKAFIQGGGSGDPGHLVACKKALEIYEQDFLRRWSTPFLQGKLEACQQNGQTHFAEVYEAEIRRRGA